MNEEKVCKITPCHNRSLLAAKGSRSKFPHPELLTLTSTSVIFYKISLLFDKFLLLLSIKRPPSYSSSVFHLSSNQLFKLKEIYNKNQDKSSHVVSYVSTIDMVSSLLTILIATAKKTKKDFRTLTMVNCRSKIRPQLPPFFVGNAICPAMVPHSINHFSDTISLVTLSNIAKDYRTAILKVDDNFFRDMIEYISEKRQPQLVFPKLGKRDFAFTSWSNLGLLDAEFISGVWASYAGPPADCSGDKVHYILDHPVPIGSNQSKGDGLDIVVNLESTAMDRFRDMWAVKVLPMLEK